MFQIAGVLALLVSLSVKAVQPLPIVLIRLIQDDTLRLRASFTQ